MTKPNAQNPDSTGELEFTPADVKANESIGWFIDGSRVYQVVSISPREIRPVGKLAQPAPESLNSAEIADTMPIESQEQPGADKPSESTGDIDKAIARFGDACYEHQNRNATQAEADLKALISEQTAKAYERGRRAEWELHHKEDNHGE